MTDLHKVHVEAILRRIAEFDEFCSTVKNTDPARVWELLRIIKHHAKMMERTDDDGFGPSPLVALGPLVRKATEAEMAYAAEVGAEHIKKAVDDEILMSALEMAYVPATIPEDDDVDFDEIVRHGTECPVCPSCGEEQDVDQNRGEFYTEDAVETSCPSCGADFTSYACLEWLFSTEKGHTETEEEEDTDV